jgi:hypothetical protein
MFLEGGNDEVLAAWSEGADPHAPVFSADNFVLSRAAARRIRGYRLTNPGARRLSAEARSLFSPGFDGVVLLFRWRNGFLREAAASDE